ncbi:hypothetical protein EXE30_06670 [Acinetobacter halotolerans]|uniref:Uncharacterized protein n=1 Tax=Acinetobacter halotolerans TaxID=1752076 RepID=A0A4V2DB19_9GAMM|nr:hypothetical protein [Acinetobacter halotolerans]RZF53653.1 hypothetical protein EXE30_06670 [Acinetobacter halotolerans]
MTKDIELKAIDELIYEVEMFEQAGVYPVQDFIDNLKTLSAKVKEETKLEGCVVVPVEPTPKMIDSTWDDQDEIEKMSHNSRNEFIYKKMIKVAMLEAARGGNE